MAGDFPQLIEVPTTTYYPVHTYKNYPVNQLGEPLLIKGYTDSGLPKLATMGVVQASLIAENARRKTTEVAPLSGIKGVIMNLIGKIINREPKPIANSAIKRNDKIRWDYPGISPLPSWQY